MTVLGDGRNGEWFDVRGSKFSELGTPNFELPIAFVYNATKGRSSGGLAQLGEHYVRNVGVAGSTPVPSTIF